MLYNQLILEGNLMNKLPNNIDEQIQILNDSVKYIEGETTAGNNNPLLFDKLEEDIRNLFKFKAITLKFMQDYIKNINDFRKNI